MIDTPPNDKSPQLLEPLPYLVAIRDFLKSEEPAVWTWYKSHQSLADQAEAIRFDLLKSTYRLDRQSQPKLYAMADEVANALALDVSVTIYQAQHPQGLNASMAFLPNEAHIVLHGPITSKLTELEQRALLAHELSHHLLWQGWGGEFQVVDQVLNALMHDAEAQATFSATARLVGMYVEIFCDRGALMVVDDPLAVVSMLVKVQTNLDLVDAESYVRQAEEVFSQRPAKAAGISHPEAFIRARAISLWHENDANATHEIGRMIEGPLELNALDLLGQQKVARLTRRLIDAYLAPKWMQTDSVLAHARLFFDDYAPPAEYVDDAHRVGALCDDMKTDDPHLQDYYCYVLLDFVTADRDLEELPLAAALKLVEEVGLKSRFTEVARKELRLRVKQLKKVDQSKHQLLARAADAAETTLPVS